MSGQHIVANLKHKSDVEIARGVARIIDDLIEGAYGNDTWSLDQITEVILAAITEARQQNEAEPTEVGCTTGWLSLAVGRIERQNKHLRVLTGQVLATLEVNHKRDPSGMWAVHEDFPKLLESWQRRFEEAKI